MTDLHAQPHAVPYHHAGTSGPRGIPILGNALEFGRDQLGFLERSAREYGSVVRMNLAGWPTLLVSDMAAIEKILVREPRSFIKNRIIWRHVTALFGQGLLTSEGDFWHRQRRLAAPPFAGRQLLDYGPDMVRLTHDQIAVWRDGQVIDIHRHMMELTLRIAAKTLFDTEVAQDIREMDHAVDDLVDELAARFKRPMLIPDWVPLPGHRRYRRAIATVEQVISRIVAERRLSGDIAVRRDLLSRLMDARDDNGQPMSDKQLRDEAVTMLLAGHETTALALSWTFHLLGKDPTAWQRLVNEVDTALGRRDATPDDIQRLGFTEAVIKEAMRLYPPAWAIGRESVTPFEIAGETFPAGTTIFISQWVLHRDRRYFDDPLEFIPDRWLYGALEQRLPRFAYMPFGGGPRVCIGQRFAMIEAVLILATIAQRFTTEGIAGREPTPFPSITLRPAGGVWARLFARPERLH